MTPQQLVEEIQEDLSEWIEMSEDPKAFVVGVLANKVIKLKEYVDYLEIRLKHERTRNKS